MDAEHGRVAKEQALAARQRVDAGGHQRLDRVGKLLQRSAGAHGGEQLLEEQRVALRAGEDLAALGGAERQVVGEHEQAGVLEAERLELDRRHRDSLEVHAVGDRTAGDDAGDTGGGVGR